MLTNLNHYIERVKSTHDDDSIDRLNYVTTIYVLLGFALTLFAKNYVGEPMQCWVPNQWTGTWEAFSESYCFVENTYFVPMNHSNLPPADTREGREMIYYQWVPFILSLMALFFYIPRGVWNIFSSYSGLALADLMTAARKSAKTGADDPYIPSIARTLQKVHTSKVVRYGSSLFNLYIIMKVLIFGNLLLQFFCLNHFLGTEYTFWGLGIALDMLRGRQWQQSGHFPRVNMFNEKIFIFLWFWFALLLFFTFINLFTWIRRRFSTSARKTFLFNVLTDSGLDTTEAEREEFYRDVVQDDGLLVLLLLDANGGRLQSGELAHQLWTSKFPQHDDKTISTVAEEEAMNLNKQLWDENYPISACVCLSLYTLYVEGSLASRTDYLKPSTQERSHQNKSHIRRLKYVYTPWILCGTAFLIFAHEYVGEPIQCWAPKQWAGGWEQYAEQFCLIENTYFVKMNDSNLPAAQEREDREIRYYQVTFCDLEVRELGGAVHRWSLQCVLVVLINMFNEKIFVFLWWWFCMLLFISILNLFRWLIRLSFDAQRSFITAVLESTIDDDIDAREVSEFCRKMLKADGVTIVRLIEENATIYQRPQPLRINNFNMATVSYKVSKSFLPTYKKPHKKGHFALVPNVAEFWDYWKREMIRNVHGCT
ncbi:unnamed protein product [Haemonchus placei]|uniref:Innexin n=1 Tax=Haemonchus placei TaxID=6290 RepID=A0A0N4W0W1_HAEPC|nr:unnamed protein product [Haemonchus placei]